MDSLHTHSIKTRSTNGVELALYDLGGNGPAVVLAHATGFHGRVWIPLANQLRDNFHLYALDFRAHGASGPPGDGDFSWSGMADDVLATVDAFGLERPFGLGHSMGGAGLFLGEQARPGTFRSIYVYEPIVFPHIGIGEPPPLETNPLSAGALRRRNTFSSKTQAIENYAAKAPLDCLDPEVLNAYVEYGFIEQPDGTVALACQREHEAQCYRMGATHGGFGQLHRIKCPVVIASGALTNAISPDMARMQANAIPNGAVSVFESLGHFGPLEDPTEVAKSAAGFFLDAGF